MEKEKAETNTLAMDPEHLAIFLVEATGGIHEAAQVNCPRLSILNRFCTIVRYNAMAAHTWVQYYLRSGELWKTAICLFK